MCIMKNFLVRIQIITNIERNISRLWRICMVNTALQLKILSVMFVIISWVPLTNLDKEVLC
jgi:hypothetical protein